MEKAVISIVQSTAATNQQWSLCRLNSLACRIHNGYYGDSRWRYSKGLKSVVAFVTFALSGTSGASVTSGVSLRSESSATSEALGLSETSVTSVTLRLWWRVQHDELLC